MNKTTIFAALAGSIIGAAFFNDEISAQNKVSTDEKYQRFTIFRHHDENAFHPTILLDTATGNAWSLGWLTTYKHKVSGVEVEKPERFCWNQIYAIKDSENFFDKNTQNNSGKK